MTCWVKLYYYNYSYICTSTYILETYTCTSNERPRVSRRMRSSNRPPQRQNEVQWTMGQNIFKLKNTRRFVSIAQTLDVIISQVDQKATKHEKLYTGLLGINASISKDSSEIHTTTRSKSSFRWHYTTFRFAAFLSMGIACTVSHIPCKVFIFCSFYKWAKF